MNFLSDDQPIGIDVPEKESKKVSLLKLVGYDSSLLTVFSSGDMRPSPIGYSS